MAEIIKEYGGCKVEYNSGKPTIMKIPRGSELSISALPHRREVIKTKASGSYTPSSLDPGKYVFTVLKPNLFNNPHRVWSSFGEFLVDVDEAGYQRLVFMKPRFAKGVMTSEGAKWTCGVSNCSDSFTSIIAAIMHEGDHLGIDFLHATIDEAEMALLGRGKELIPKEPTVDLRAAAMAPSGIAPTAADAPFEFKEPK